MITLWLCCEIKMYMDSKKEKELIF